MGRGRERGQARAMNFTYTVHATRNCDGLTIHVRNPLHTFSAVSLSSWKVQSIKYQLSFLISFQNPARQLYAGCTTDSNKVG